MTEQIRLSDESYKRLFKTALGRFGVDYRVSKNATRKQFTDDWLERNGLIRREPQADGSFVVSLTVAGWELLNQRLAARCPT